MATFEQVAQILKLMAHAYPRYELSPDTIELYARMLSDIPLDALEAGTKEIMANNTFFPSIAELRNKALDIVLNARGIPSPTEAWEEVIRKINEVGSYNFPEFSHTLIDKSVRSFGWKRLCQSEQIEFDRTQFIKTYETYYNRAVYDAKMLPEVKAVSDKYALLSEQKLLSEGK